MLKAIRKNKVEPEPKKIKIFINNGCCKQCLKKDALIAITNDGGLSHCTRCNVDSFVSDEIKTDTMDNFKKNIISFTI